MLQHFSQRIGQSANLKQSFRHCLHPFFRQLQPIHHSRMHACMDRPFHILPVGIQYGLPITDQALCNCPQGGVLFCRIHFLYFIFRSNRRFSHICQIHTSPSPLPKELSQMNSQHFLSILLSSRLPLKCGPDAHRFLSPALPAITGSNNRRQFLFRYQCV